MTANDFVQAYCHVRDGDYNVLNRLRFWVQCFSGYNLKQLSCEFEHEKIGCIPGKGPQQTNSSRTDPDQWVKMWVEFTKAIPPSLRFSPRIMLGEIGWLVDDIVVNHDTYVYQERVNILQEAEIVTWLQGLGRAPRILEIGGGYGALTYALRRIFPSAVCVICDLPESLLFSGLYLTLCERDETELAEPENDGAIELSKPGVTLLSNYQLHMLLDQHASFDLVINTLSMSEMTKAQVNAYAAAIGRVIGRSGVFFEQNQNNRKVGFIDCKNQLRGHFPWSYRLRPRSAAMTEGRADLWANADPPFAQDWPDPQTRLDDLLGTLDRGTEQIASLQTTLQERSQRISSLEQTLNERSQRICSLEEALSDRDQRLKALEVTSLAGLWRAAMRRLRRSRALRG